MYEFTGNGFTIKTCPQSLEGALATMPSILSCANHNAFNQVFRFREEPVDAIAAFRKWKGRNGLCRIFTCVSRTARLANLAMRAKLEAESTLQSHGINTTVCFG